MSPMDTNKPGGDARMLWMQMISTMAQSGRPLPSDILSLMSDSNEIATEMENAAEHLVSARERLMAVQLLQSGLQGQLPEEQQAGFDCRVNLVYVVKGTQVDASPIKVHVPLTPDTAPAILLLLEPEMQVAVDEVKQTLEQVRLLLSRFCAQQGLPVAGDEHEREETNNSC